MTLAWTGFALTAGGALVITLYTLANFRWRRLGPNAAWRGGWIMGGAGMSLTAAGWALLALSGPRFDLPPLRLLGAALSLLATAVYCLAACRVGRLRPLERYSLRLHTGGIYKLVRHPQALALCVLAAGVGLATLSQPFLLGLPLSGGFWVAYTYIEEHFELLPAFGGDYRRYALETPRILPTFKSLKAFHAEGRRAREGRKAQLSRRPRPQIPS
jgi:protein-S-isoprenylcysteine O-methyltransferase Ste14